MRANRARVKVHAKPYQGSTKGKARAPVQSRQKRGFDFYFGKTTEEPFFVYALERDPGEAEFKRRVYAYCGPARLLYGHTLVADVLEEVFTQLQKTNSHIRRINLTSEVRYDVIYNTLRVLIELFPKAEDKFRKKLNRLEIIRARFDDNYRFGREHYRRR